MEDEIGRIKSRGGRITLKRIAVMGCVVNGPGEAREADIGVAGDGAGGVLFRHGEVERRLAREDLLPALLEEIHRHAVFPAGSDDRPRAT